MTKVSEVKKFLESFPDDAEVQVSHRDGTPSTARGTYLVVRGGGKGKEMKIGAVREIIN